MNLLDIAILGVLAIFLVKGIWRGFLRELCSLFGLLVGAILAFRFGGPLADLMAESLRLPEKLCAVAAYLLLFLTSVLFFAALGYLLSRFVRLAFLGGLNRVLGGFLAVAEGALLLAVVLFAGSLGDPPRWMEREYRGSSLAPPFVQLGKAAFEGSRDLLAGWREPEIAAGRK